ncbi:TlyA family RNA methyltransferase [Microbacterium sp. cx-55]|uniref:TlyA family RNA methyltransferase n=1 Tax=unclassified Microbacterium TaxID=2609290 RepID=UPI001CBA9C9D|nr:MULTISPECIES: TlyA family RNA methyltransferase [unclassified Microbacterium]MBZ4486800.1 TlyA family RNA methyltransferase [Microbacterium sp. cx-55]MCC4907821.1 TlyA family RNA methyltransferase [Microbacterium sp. cx-59]UGB36244.1 TlyA family RNA methyltransferase [Microbacterium sp. cx-55]
MSPRLDAELAARGLARSRSHAATLVTDGLVRVDGMGVVKPSHSVTAETTIDVAASDHYVSRAAHKLVAALDSFAIDVSGRAALDMGASTGGFTQVLRERGASRVVAVDVGHGQLAPRVAADAGVTSIEGFNVRYMTPESLAEAVGEPFSPDVITGDLSFISLGHVLPAVRAVSGDDTDIVLLIKPQFEVGRTAVRGGLVTDAALRADAVSQVLWTAWDQGLGVRGLITSPILGTHGNSEYVVHLGRRGGSIPTEWESTVIELTGVR